MVAYTPPQATVSLGPATSLFAITPSDATPLPVLTRYIYVGGAGNLVVQAAADAAPVTFTAVPVGTLLPVCAAFVKSTSTTATLLVGMT